jgi:DNA polymerase
LRAQIDLIDPALVVTLGATALHALTRLEPHDYRLRDHVGQPLAWYGRLLVPLYHPSPRAGLSRSYPDQEGDFRRLGRLVRSVSPDTESSVCSPPAAALR